MKKFDPKTTVYLIDGSSFLYRAYYGMRPLHTSKGVPVQAVYSFCRMIQKLIKKFAAQNVVLVWDSKGKTTRHEMLPSYKETRQAAPSDLFVQKDYIVQFADLIGLPQVAQVGIEADDLMYSITKEMEKKGFDVVLLTTDKDMGQMLDEHTFMYDFFNEILYDVSALEEKMGFSVDKIPFYFALLGDSSDNIPGVAGIGKKGAQELVQQFASLEDAYQHLDQIEKTRTRNALAEHKEDALLSLKLFLLQYHPVGLTDEQLRFDGKKWAQARPLFQELEFKSLLAETTEEKGEQAVATKLHKFTEYEFVAVTTEKQLNDLCAELKKAAWFALDTETTGLNPLVNKCIGISLCTGVGKAYYVPFGHASAGQQLSFFQENVAPGQLAQRVVIAALKPILEDAQYKKVLHHAKFDMLALFGIGITLRGLYFDTLVAASLVSPSWQKIGLKPLSEKYFNEAMPTFEEMVTQQGYTTFAQVPVDVATPYAALDAHQTFRLKELLEQELVSMEMLKLYQEIELPLVEVLFAMEARGIHLDVAQLADLGKKVSSELHHIEQSILRSIGKENSSINLNSPKQIEDLLFNQLLLPPQKKSAKKTGYSTDVEVLQELAKLHPVPGMIIKYRELAKLQSTYIAALPGYVNPHTGNIHTTFSQTSVATGRLASSDPNLQNIPTDVSGYGIEVRAAFKPIEGHVYLSADYSQIELRVLAEFSGDKNLCHAFLEQHDIHAETAARLFDVPLDQVSHEQRQIGKRINFSILYGLTPYGLSRDLDISFKDAKLYIDKYFAQYPGVSAWMEDVIAFTKEHGYVTTMWGRRRAVPDIYEKNKTMYELAHRVAINTRAQGTAAEVMKKGMIAVHHALAEKKLGAFIVLQIHDELLISVPYEEREETEKLVKELLENVVSWQVPLVVTTRFGRNWKDVTK